jgi:mRNA-degrading endonuclease RelE of RelBE toxin-antitoxin system
MTDFQVALTDHAIADLKALHSGIRDQIHFDLESLKPGPFPSGTRIKRLKNFRPPVYRLRSGDFRVLYWIRDRTVILLRIVDRKLLDRVIKRLKIQAP